MTETATALYLFLDAAGFAVDIDAADVAVIQDNTTGLQWSAKPLLDGQNMTQPECEKQGKRCALLNGADWQLPTIQQMRTVEDLTRFAPAVKEPFAKFWPSHGWAWTRSTPADPGYSDYAWDVDLNRGGASIGSRDYRGVALACRPVPVVASPRQ